MQNKPRFVLPLLQILALGNKYSVLAPPLEIVVETGDKRMLSIGQKHFKHLPMTVFAIVPNFAGCYLQSKLMKNLCLGFRRTTGAV